MRVRTHPLIFLSFSAGCGYVGVDDLQQNHLDVENPVASGGKVETPSGGGDSGDGDIGGTGAGAHTGGSNDGIGGVGTGGREFDNTGGSPLGMGGESSAAGGTWSTDAEIWSDPEREGCEPFCATPNTSFSTHFFFEQDEVPAPGVTSNGELFVATDQANWGESSLGVSFEKAPASAYIPIDIDVGADNWIHVRAWLYVPSDVITADVGLLEFLSGDLPAAQVDAHPGARLSASAPIDGVTLISEESVYPFDEWFCLRAAVYTDHLEGMVTVESDGSVITELTNVDTRGVIDVNKVKFGVTETGPGQGSGTIYWDSVVIDQEAVACGTMVAPQIRQP